MSNRTVPAYKRVHILGDSYTQGLYATAGNEYRALLLTSLQSVNALNATEIWSKSSVVGGKLVDQLGNLPGAWLYLNRPHLCFLALGQNDRGGPTPVDESTFRGAARDVMDYVVNFLPSYAVLIVVAVPFQPTWPGTINGTYAAIYNRILREEAEDRGFWFAPNWDDAQTPAGISSAADVIAGEATTADGYHPNNTGHQQLHDALWGDIGGLVSRALRRKTNARAQATGRAAASGRAAA